MDRLSQLYTLLLVNFRGNNIDWPCLDDVAVAWSESSNRIFLSFPSGEEILVTVEQTIPPDGS